MNLDRFRHDDWIKIWAGSWSFLTCSHFANQYTDEIRFGPMPFIEKSIILIKNGKSEAWARQSDRDKLGRFLSDDVIHDENRVTELCATFRREVDEILLFIENAITKQIDESTYRRFWDKVLSYYGPHIHVKYVVDYLDPSLLEKYLPALEEVRLYAESVFTHTEIFMKKLTEQIAEKTGYSREQISCLTKNEMYTYFEHESLPDKQILDNRNERAALVSLGKDLLIFSGIDVQAIEDLTHPVSSEEMVRGKSAYPGTTQGIARIVSDPSNPGIFNEGDILVAGMTRPEYLYLMKKAAAFVTDAGGVLSHAAITAREMKKPAVIGTQIATKVLHNGDLIEVDADKGVVTILKRA